jgi:hypothetical protein
MNLVINQIGSQESVHSSGHNFLLLCLPHPDNFEGLVDEFHHQSQNLGSIRIGEEIDNLSIIIEYSPVRDVIWY